MFVWGLNIGLIIAKSTLSLFLERVRGAFQSRNKLFNSNIKMIEHKKDGKHPLDPILFIIRYTLIHHYKPYPILSHGVVWCFWTVCMTLKH